MDVSVLLHVGFLVEPFPAILTRIRSRIRVDQQVSRERRRSFKRFPALSAFKYLFSIMQRSEESKEIYQ